MFEEFIGMLFFLLTMTLLLSLDNILKNGHYIENPKYHVC